MVWMVLVGEKILHNLVTSGAPVLGFSAVR
jgi:hypothetical protein